MKTQRLTNIHLCFRTFKALKNYLGDPGKNYAWHHIVEQSQSGKRANFPPEWIHNTHNIVAIPSGRNTIHAKISAFYSSKQPFSEDKIVRDWLANKSYDFQFEFGKRTLEKYGTLNNSGDGWIFKKY